MRIEYSTDQDPGTVFRRELPARMYHRAGALYLARLLAEEIIGAELAGEVRILVTDDNGERLAAFESKADPKASGRVRFEEDRPDDLVCATCLEPGDEECAYCGGESFVVASTVEPVAATAG